MSEVHEKKWLLFFSNKESEYGSKNDLSCMKVISRCFGVCDLTDFLHSFRSRVRKTMIFDTQNSVTSEFSIAHVYKYKNQTACKNEAKTEKSDTSHQFTHVPEKHSFAHRP